MGNPRAESSGVSSRGDRGVLAEIVLFAIDSSRTGAGADDLAQCHEFQAAVLVQSRGPIYRQFHALPKSQLSLGGKQNAAARNVLRPAAAGLRNAFGLQQLIADVVLEGKPVGGPPIGCREILAVTAHRFLFSNSIM